MAKNVQTNPGGEVEYSQDANEDTGDTPQCHRIDIERTENGGFVVECFEGHGMSAPKKYALKTRQELDDLLDSLWGAPDESAPDVSGQSASAPPAGGMASGPADQ